MLWRGELKISVCVRYALFIFLVLNAFFVSDTSVFAQNRPVVEEIIVSSEGGVLSVAQGGTLQFFAAVNGEPSLPDDITWAVEGGSEGTSIDEKGLLTVAENQVLSGLIVRAYSSVPDYTDIYGEMTLIVASAAEGQLFDTAGDTGSDIQPPSSIWSFISLILTLALVAAAIYGIVYFIKRSSRGKTAHDPFLKVLASAQLSVNRSIHVVNLGEQAWLVGSAESGVHLIGEIQDKDIINTLLLQDSKKNTGGLSGNFKGLLSRLGMRQDGSSISPDKIRKRHERLKGL